MSLMDYGALNIEICNEVREQGHLASAAQFAHLKDPDLPGTKQGVGQKAKREHWPIKGRRNGAGGGLLFDAREHSSAYRRWNDSTAAETRLADRAETETAVIETSSDALSARRRRVMEARAAVLREVERRAAFDGTGITEAIRNILAEAKAGLCDETLADVLKLAADLKRSGVPSERSIFRWRRAYSDGVLALAPQVRRSKRPLDEICPWLMPFMGFYARPSKPTIAHALDQYRRSPDRIGDAPSYEQVRRALKSLEGTPDHLMAFKGREGPLALKARLAYVSRSTEGLEPTTIYTADGKTFDAEVQHPRSGKPFRPEITTVIDVVTRKVVGWSVALDETAEAVADAVRHSVERCGVPAIFYSDRGKGYKNRRISMTTLSLCSRLSISATQSLPYNSQARGVIERAHGTIWNRLSKEYPSYMGKDMDKEAAKRVFGEVLKLLGICRRCILRGDSSSTGFSL